MATDDSGQDPDRAAILARRRHFVALALSGLTTAGCKHNQPEPCLSIAQPTDGAGQDGPSPDGPFVEDPGVPVAEPEPEPETDPEPESDGGGELEPGPQPCLKVAAPSPRPCLKKKPPPRVCLLIID